MDDEDPLASLSTPLLMTDATSSNRDETGPSGKTKYELVGNGNEEEGLVDSIDDEDEEDHVSIVQGDSRWFTVLHARLLPDNQFAILGVPLVDGDFPVKLLKFAALTYGGIAFMHWFVRVMEWEHDGSLKLGDVWVYESNSIVLDIVFFFVVGRLHKQRGVDHLAWVGFAFLANIYSSYITNFPFLQHSFTLFEMHCTWPWKLWVFVMIATPIGIGLALLHVRRAVNEGIFTQKVMELLLCLIFLLAPLMTSPYFHLHHWFAGWLVGMHCNFDVWWSRAVMAWCWGAYINGIAVYGRDPVLTCGYAYFISQDQHCPFLSCYLKGLEELQSANHTPSDPSSVTPMVPPDWRNCSSSSYHG